MFYLFIYIFIFMGFAQETEGAKPTTAPSHNRESKGCCVWLAGRTQHFAKAQTPNISMDDTSLRRPTGFPPIMMGHIITADTVWDDL